MRRLLHSGRAKRGGGSRRAEQRRERAAQLAMQMRWGSLEQRKAAAFALRQRFHGLQSIAKRGGGYKVAAHMRGVVAAKREELEWQRRAPERAAAKRRAMIIYGTLGPASTSYRPGGKCAYVGCDCEGSLPDHFCGCVNGACACGGALHPLR